jgi:CubicO group peptidase (beta-lactamase class C family)
LTPRVEGTCDGAFAAVRDAFAENFANREEHGAAVAVWHRGRLVVDLWGGWRDCAATAPWAADTMVCMMSVVKAVTALLVHVLADRGHLDLDKPVSAYWPEFAQGGKVGVLVRHVLDHRAGVPAISNELPPGAVLDWNAMIDAIAGEPPRWPAGTVPAYHVVTMGFIAGEVIRRVTGSTPGMFLREVAAELGGLDYYISVPAADIARCADVSGDYRGTIFGANDPATLAYTSVAQVRPEMFNTAAFRRAEIPSINGHGTARAIATLFGRLAQCRAGRADTPISTAALERATMEQWHGIEQTSMQERRMALGFLLGGVEDVPINDNPRSFGHGGAGGALAFADPDLDLGFAYGPSRLHGRKGASPRTKALVDAVMTCV